MKFNFKISESSNIKKHLEKFHRQLDNWFKAYNAKSKFQSKTLIDMKTLKLVKFFIVSNSAAALFDLDVFRDILEYKIPC